MPLPAGARSQPLPPLGKETDEPCVATSSAPVPSEAAGVGDALAAPGAPEAVADGDAAEVCGDGAGAAPHPSEKTTAASARKRERASVIRARLHDGVDHPAFSDA